jgi:predicted  nucleic acid-binding Zn-ribbon protein
MPRDTPPYISHLPSQLRMSDITSLLALQNDDLAIHDIETRLAALEPRIRDLDAKRQRIVDTITRQSALVESEEKKQAFLRDKIQEHRQLIDRNQAQLDAVKTMRQATAAAAQMEQAKKIVAGEESDLLALNRRLEEMRGVLTAAKTDLAACEAEQATARAEVTAERGTLEGELAAAREKRKGSAGQVPDALRTRYDRIRNKKRVHVVVALNALSCGACDTAIPMQRRHAMLSGNIVELCEVCGVLMYHAV